MKARLQNELPAGENWIYEVKLDGIRAIVVRNGPRVQLWSRRPRDMTAEYPDLVRSLRNLPVKRFVADGEIVALDPKGRPSFRLLQGAKSKNHAPIRLYLFDLLNRDGRDLKGLPLTARKRALESMLKQQAGDQVRFCGSLEGKPAHIWNAINQQGLEGVIAKRRGSPYEPGQRSGAWVKIKSQVSQEFVIGGYTLPEGSRKYFGSLVLGYYEGGALMFASRVGTGFDFKTLKSLHAQFQPLRIEACPFVDLPAHREQRYGQGLTRAEMGRCVWLKPKLVCQVKFMEWTRHLQLRMPVFLGLRPDKKATEVVRETGSSRRQETHTSRTPATSDPV